MWRNKESGERKIRFIRQDESGKLRKWNAETKNYKLINMKKKKCRVPLELLHIVYYSSLMQSTLYCQRISKNINI